MGPDAMFLIFWMLSFKPTFSLSSFTFIKRLFSSSSLSAIRVVSSVYLRLLRFHPATLIPACVSSSAAFLMMYSAYKLNKQGDNIQPWRKPLTVWITINCGKFWKRWEYQTAWPASWEICMQVRKQQLELDMEQQTGSKSGKEYIKAVYRHPAYLT